MTKPLHSTVLLIFALGASAGPGAAGLDLPGTLNEAMDLAKPESIGTPVLAAWWSVDGRDLYYRHMPPGAKKVATFGVSPRGPARHRVQRRMPRRGRWQAGCRAARPSTASLGSPPRRCAPAGRCRKPG